MSTHKNKKEKRTTALKSVAIVLAIVLLCTSAFLFIRVWEKDHGKFQESTEVLNDNLDFNGIEYALKDNLETVLILGLDKFNNDDSGYNNDKQADFLMLLVIDHSAKTCSPIHINRDAMVTMDVLGVAGDKIGTAKKQIALSHTYGNGREVSCRNTANAVSGLLLGMEIDHYVSVTMEAVPVYNDFVGGVTVEILDDFSSYNSGDKCVIVGIISKIQKKKTKTGSQFAFANIYSGDGLIEVTIWPDALQKFQNLIVKGQQVAILGKKEGEDKMIVDKIKSYDQWLDDVAKKRYGRKF